MEGVSFFFNFCELMAVLFNEFVVKGSDSFSFHKWSETDGLPGKRSTIEVNFNRGWE